MSEVTNLDQAVRPRVGLTSRPDAIFSGPMGNAPDAVKRLVERFDQNRDAYLSGSYNETQLRREFLGPFFTTLGRDVDD